jgi:hypothetical protein
MLKYLGGDCPSRDNNLKYLSGDCPSRYDTLKYLSGERPSRDHTLRYLSGDCLSRNNMLKSLKEWISVKFDVGLFYDTANKCTQYAVHTFLLACYFLLGNSLASEFRRRGITQKKITYNIHNPANI